MSDGQKHQVLEHTLQHSPKYSVMRYQMASNNKSLSAYINVAQHTVFWNVIWQGTSSPWAHPVTQPSRQCYEMLDMLTNQYPKGHELFYNTAKQTMLLGVKYQGYFSLHRDSKVVLFYCIGTRPQPSEIILHQRPTSDWRCQTWLGIPQNQRS